MIAKAVRLSIEVIGVQREAAPPPAADRAVAARAALTPSQWTRTLASDPAGILEEPIFSV